MRHFTSLFRLGPAVAFAASLATLLGPLTARAQGPVCPLLAPVLANGAPLSLRPNPPDKSLVILAIGSSSTQGVAASGPKATYPAQLQSQLFDNFHVFAQVRNAGIGGENAQETLARLKSTIAKNPPDLVIWQVGTNDALEGVAESKFRDEVDTGIGEVLERKLPLLLIDPQLTAAHTGDAAYERYAAVIEEEALRYHVPVLSRFQMMKALSHNDPKEWLSMLSGDGVHMNDHGYECLAKSLAAPIAKSAAIGSNARL